MYRYLVAAAFALCFVFAASSVSATIPDAAYYFNLANELVDLPYPGNEFYGEVDLTLTSLNNVRIDVNAYVSPGEYDAIGNFIFSPLVAGPNFGIDKFGMNSCLIASQDDYDTFMSYYDMTLPSSWGVTWGGVAGELGKFEFWYKGTGDSRMDPLVILITPKIGVTIPTEYMIDDVGLFVEECPQGTLFAMHVGDFTVDSSYWESESFNPESSFFAVGGDSDTFIPEPATVCLVLAGLGAVVVRRRRR